MPDIKTIFDTEMVKYAIAAVFGGLLWALKQVYTSQKNTDHRLTALEVVMNDVAGLKQSVSSIGQRVGNLESFDQVIENNHKQLVAAMEELKSDRKELAAMMADIFNSVNTIKTDVAVMKERIK
jgi:hypothetical protein